jgi:GLPGLI family protein
LYGAFLIIWHEIAGCINMKKIGLIFFCFLSLKIFAQQKIVAECTINYSISADSLADKDFAESLKQSSKTVFIKGNDVRIDLASPALIQSFFFKASAATAVVLREFGNNKFITNLDKDALSNQNLVYDSVTAVASSETKNILGRDCKKITLTLKNRDSIIVFYAKDIIPSVRNYEYIFKDIPGLVMQYQTIEKNGKKITYTAIKVDTNTILPESKFNVPTSGYRLLE